MICNKKIQRNFSNMFDIFTCSTCYNSYKYEYIYIGNNTINIYELNNECINNIIKQKMIKIFLKEKIINTQDLYLIINKYQYIRIFDYLPLLIDEDNCNLYILIL